MKKRKIQLPAFYQIPQPSGSTDDKMWGMQQYFLLSCHICSADTEKPFQFHALCKDAQLINNLHSQLPRRCYDKHAFISIEKYFIDQRYKKRGRFPGSGICNPDNIPSF